MTDQEQSEAYYRVQEAVYKSLSDRLRTDDQRYFTLRRKYNKDTYRNYFTGTEKSKYFVFSNWYINNSYPGASIDPLVFVALQKEDYWMIYLQLMQTNSPFDGQNELVLQLLKNITNSINNSDTLSEYTLFRNNEKNKMFKVQVFPEHNRLNENEVPEMLIKMVDHFSPIIEKEIALMKEKHEDFNAEGISREFFKKMLEGRERLTDKVINDIPTFQEVVREVIVLSEMDEEFDFRFEDIEDGYVWIGDHSGLIGGKRAHYEIQKTNNSDTYVFVHFEDEYCHQIKEMIGENLPDRIEWYKWGLGEGIRVGGFEMLREPDTPNMLYDKLKRVENELGDRIRSVLRQLPREENMKLKGEGMIPNGKAINKILYGPPGTGKTYSTINHALSLLGISTDNLEREHVKKLFKEQVDQGRVVFTTFHQSMSYEEFIEGIKPIAPKAEGEDMYYDIEDGIFKQLASKAEINQTLSQIETDGSNLGNTELFDGAFQLLKEKIKTALVTNEVIEEKDNYRKGFVIDLQNSFFSITAISGSSIKMMTKTGNEKNSMTRDTLREIYNDPDRLDEIITGGMSTYYRALVNEMLSWNQEIKQEAKKTSLQNYVLIIDEINRGNVSAIFGELITLLEPDKRLGQPEELRLTLPYSKTEFGVPSNLHIIGTMNTADRSVEALDTALRRRFEFEEVMPDPELLSPSAMYCRLLWKYSDVVWEDRKFKEVESSFFEFYNFTEDEAFKKSKKSIWARMESESQPNKLDYFKDVNWGGIDLQKILETINERIELLVDRDHTIGHSYLMNLTGMEDLVAAFRDKIVPLLQEYFYGDYGKIGLVLGNGFVQRDDNSTKEFSSFKYENKKDFVTDSYSLKKITVDNIKQALQDLLETDRTLQAKRKAIQEISAEE